MDLPRSKERRASPGDRTVGAIGACCPPTPLEWNEELGEPGRMRTNLPAWIEAKPMDVVLAGSIAYRGRGCFPTLAIQDRGCASRFEIEDSHCEL